VSALADLLRRLDAAPPTLGSGRLVCIDGPAGSGKTTFAQGVADRVEAAHLLHTDDLIEGWRGLSGLDARLEGVLGPLALGRPGSYRRYDWVEGAYAETVTVEPCPLLVIEGVGSGAARFEDLRTLLVWVEAPYDERLRRGLERDGDAFAPHWEQWALDEAALYAREGTRERADVHLDGTAPFDAPSAS
jgi:chloramphenicol 3-O-phosphotransferase